MDSDKLFDDLIQEVQGIEHGFIALNIQETDLAGHAEDVDRYSDRLELSDRRIKELIPYLNKRGYPTFYGPITETILQSVIATIQENGFHY